MGHYIREGQHEGLVSYEIFDRVQTRLKEGAKAPARKDIREDFPLRGFVECSDCNRPLTACHSKSATGVQHPYYRSYHRPCEGYGKSIRRDKLEGEFEALLKSMQPSTQVFELAKVMFKDVWTQRGEQSKSLMVGIKKQIVEFEKQINQLVERIVDTDNNTIISAYERKITELEKNKLLASRQLANQGKPKHTFDEMFELAMKFLSTPWNIWEKGDLTLKKMVLRLAFSGRISYDRKTGSLNWEKSIPFKALEGVCRPEKAMVHPERFERPTP